MADNEQALDRLFQQFRKAFLDEMPERLDAIDGLVSRLRQTRDGRTPILEDLYRQVHNIKGSSATFGEHVVMAVCHRMEDLIRALVTGTMAVDARSVEFLARYGDLLRQGHALALSEGEGHAAVEAALDRLHEQIAGSRLTALVVVNSRVVRLICHEVLSELDVRLVEVDDALTALHRALSEPFDLVIVSSELGFLKGEALIAAVKLSPGRQHHATTILVSGSSRLRPHKRNTDPDHVIRRDTDFVRNLRRLVAARLAAAAGI